MNKNPDEQQTKRMMSLTSAAGKAGKGEQREAPCDQGKLPFLWWLPVLQAVGRGENSLRKFSKAEIHPCLSLHGALLSILLKSACHVFKVDERNTIVAKFMEARNMGGWGIGVC